MNRFGELCLFGPLRQLPGEKRAQIDWPSRGVTDRTGLATKHVERDQATAPFGHASRRAAHIRAARIADRCQPLPGKGGLTDGPVTTNGRPPNYFCKQSVTGITGTGSGCT